MNASEQVLHASNAAKRLGVSVKALRLYEQHGLINPVRTSAGWRTYGPSEIARATEIIALRALGLSLAQVARVLRGDPQGLGEALDAHQANLEGRLRELSETVNKLRAIRTDLAQGKTPAIGELARLAPQAREAGVSFDLPWPWGGETFELHDARQINYIVGPLGSGKTRLAMSIAENSPYAVFIGFERLKEGGAEARHRLERDANLRSRVDRILNWLVEDGAKDSSALTTLVVALASDGPRTLVIDLVEQGLDQPTQGALISYLRRRAPDAPSLFLLTRSSAILDLTAIGPDEAIILCPANHSPPTRVAPYSGAPGYEAVATCLASPAVRARTEGLVAMFPHGAPKQSSAPEISPHGKCLSA